jgi:ABC-type phosphate transport system substrate-binding protein
MARARHEGRSTVFKFHRLRRGALLGATVVGTAVLGLAVAGPASATVEPAANNTIIGSGSNTAYAALTALATLFNESEGCNLIVPNGVTQPYNFSCPSGGSLPAGNPPFGYGSPSVGSSYSENPFNDVVEVESGIGSSAGITQLENQGAHTTETAPVNFASSARGPNLGANGKYDDQGLNFVAYAADGIDYVLYTKVGKKATAGSTIKGLSQAQLQAIWSGTDKCWSDVGATGADANYLIDPYSVVTSSAVTSTWDAFLSPDNSETYVDAQTTWPPSPLPTCKNGATAIYTGPTFTNYAQSHTVIQNQLTSITQNKDQAYAIDFISYGRYEQQTGSSSVKGTALGAIGSPTPVKPTEKTILDGAYPVPQDLYTVYSDGTNTSYIPVSSPATLNFASEDGFLCKPNTETGAATGTQITDPVTGLTYRSEIETAITSQGFFPLDGLDENVPFEEGTETTPADAISSFTSSAYYPYDTPPVQNGEEVGYCNVVTTDGNTGHD